MLLVLQIRNFSNYFEGDDLRVRLPDALFLPIDFVRFVVFVLVFLAMGLTSFSIRVGALGGTFLTDWARILSAFRQCSTSFPSGFPSCSQSKYA